ncbi:MAG TPA: FAD-dependent monooxygenase [Steroidobacteraceae bacterium]|jgi:2-octaprenylphenol hydroxylase|nr:FAD-dependent monooxygenase [Steroidobacteraceae bacterium]
MSPDYDIAVVGAGLAGACAAALLARHTGIAAERIVLLAGALPPALAADAPPDLRVVALSRASERILQSAAAWARVPARRLCAYERMRVWQESSAPDGAGALCFDAADVGEPNLGYIAESALLQRACLESFREAGGVLRTGQVHSLATDTACVHLGLAGRGGAAAADAGEADGGGAVLSARLVIGADGAHSLVRSQAHIPARTRDYHQLALIATVRTQRPHEHTAWQRFLRTGPLALLPLFDGSSSIVWSLDTAHAGPLCDCPAAQFEQQLEAAIGGALGAVTLASERRCFPLHSVAAESYVAPRCALVGDAAHVIHPLAGQGANLGLLDAAALCEVLGAAIAQGEDPGALRALRGYEQQRRTHNLVMDAAMSAFQRGFAATSLPLAWLAGRGLGLVNRSTTLKRAFARQALGSLGALGPLPRLARAGAVGGAAAALSAAGRDRASRRR